MSEVKNIGAYVGRLLDVAVAPDRDRLLKDIVRLTGRDDFTVREGEVCLSVPLDVALAHVEPSSLLAVVHAIEEYGRLLVRAVATSPAGTLPSWRDSQSLFDMPGQGLELGLNWSIRGKVLAAAGNDVAEDLAADEAGAAGVAQSEALREDRDDLQHAVEQGRLLPREPASLGHPEPLVPRRATPPP